MKFVSRFLCIFSAIAAAATAQAQIAEGSDFREIEPYLEKYCHKCHDADVQKGDLRLDTFESIDAVLRERKTWLHVLEQLETREMPTKAPLPTEAEYEKMISWVDKAINQIDWEKIRKPGHVTLPRLTKAEYNRTMRDLIGLDVRPGDIFSEDGEGRSGFTNDRDALFTSAAQMEKYFEAAEKAIDAVMALNAPPLNRHLEAEDMFMTETKMRASQIDNEGAKGYVLNRGQMTLYESIDLPFDGFYTFTIRAGSTTDGPSAGVLRINDVEKGNVLVVGKTPATSKITSYLAKGSYQMAWNIGPVPAPPKQGTRNKKKKSPPTPLPDNASEIVTEKSTKNAPKFPKVRVETRELTNLINQWNEAQIGLQRPYEWIRLHGKDGNRDELKRFTGYAKDRAKKPAEIITAIAKRLRITPDAVEQKIQEANRESFADRKALLELANVQVTVSAKRGDFAVDWVRVEGPILKGDKERAKSVAVLFTEEKSQADNTARFIHRAFRRPPLPEELQKFQLVYDRARKADLTHTEAMKQMLVAVLVSPNFLYRVEVGQGQEFALDDWQLASRLSYFLWQSMPDETLFKLAGSGELRANLDSQIARMLADEKADVFFQSFGGQWLGYSGLGKTILPDSKAFPEFNSALAESMKQEANLLFASIFRGNQPVSDLITSRETWINGPLADLYEIPGISGTAFQKVNLESEHRGGVLGMGSILASSSTPVRTSPVLRGVFVMERLLGEDPGEPPADAGELPGNAGPNRGKTLREELEIHRDREDCASCHDKIDPLGFGLQNFDGIGRFRTKIGKKPIDSTGTLPDGTTFNGVSDLRDYLLNQRRDDFHRNVVERLLQFALGRELQTPDEAAIREILQNGEKTDFKGTELVKAIVKSYPFQNQGE